MSLCIVDDWKYDVMDECMTGVPFSWVIDGSVTREHTERVKNYEKGPRIFEWWSESFKLFVL